MRIEDLEMLKIGIADVKQKIKTDLCIGVLY